MTNATATPRLLMRHWSLVLLAPVSWAVAFGLMFSATHEACTGGSHAGLWLIAGICTPLAAAPAPFAWRRRRQFDDASAASRRARFMLGVAAGASLVFVLAMILMAVPVTWLSACRT